MINEYIVFVGKKDKELEKYMLEKGVKISLSVNKNTTSIIKTHNLETINIKKAKEKNIPIYTISQFKNKFFSAEISNITSKSLYSLIKWSGGKGDEICKIKVYFPEIYDTYLEPFIGGGAVFFHLCPKKAVISDIHKDLIAFYQSIKDGKSKDIYDFMLAHPNEEKTYYFVRDEMFVNNDLELAMRFYYQRKTCFRGMMRYNSDGHFNIPYGKYKTINFDDLLNVEYEKLLGRTEIWCKSFEYIFENYNSSDNFMFLDPPYDSNFTDYGFGIFGKKEHELLAELFKTTKIKCLLVIGETEFITNLYKNYIVDSYDKKYRFKLYSGRIDDKINNKHLIIKNY